MKAEGNKFCELFEVNMEDSVFRFVVGELAEDISYQKRLVVDG